MIPKFHGRVRKNRAGFTLTEVLVVVMIIAILMILGIAQYLKTSETGKAEQASAHLQMVAAGRRTYSLDHVTLYASGPIINACNSGACAGNGDPCDLVRCGNLTVQDWDSQPYNFYSLDASGPPSACNLGGVAGTLIACASRKICGAGVTKACVSASSPYSTWGYLVDSAGEMQTVGGAPPPGS